MAVGERAFAETNQGNIVPTPTIHRRFRREALAASETCAIATAVGVSAHPY